MSMNCCFVCHGDAGKFPYTVDSHPICPNCKLSAPYSYMQFCDNCRIMVRTELTHGPPLYIIGVNKYRQCDHLPMNEPHYYAHYTLCEPCFLFFEQHMNGG